LIYIDFHIFHSGDIDPLTNTGMKDLSGDIGVKIRNFLTAGGL
jgi:hypothetical protein